MTLELGGKSPNIIFEHVDLEATVARGFNDCMENVGQSCNAPTRMLVPSQLYTEAVAYAVKAASRPAWCAYGPAGTPTTI